MFGALADPVRRALLEVLAGGPARVVDLAARHPISRPAVSKHLRLLSEAGLLTVEDRGRERHYMLEPAALAPVTALLDRLAPQAARTTAHPVTAQALDALDTEVRRTVRERRTSRPGPVSAREETA